MEIWEGTVSTYLKQQGKKKKPKSEIRLLTGHPFSKDDKVKIVLSDEFNQHLEDHQQKVKHLEEEVEDLKKTNTQLNIESKEVLKKLTVATSIISQQKNVINNQDTLLAIYMNRGILSRLRNPIPKELKTLEDNKNKLVELEDNRPLIIELTGKKDKG